MLNLRSTPEFIGVTHAPMAGALTDEIGLYDGVRTLVDAESNFPPTRIVPAGTEGTVVECYRDPEGYVVDLSIPDDSLVGGLDFETATLTRDQFELINKHIGE